MQSIQFRPGTALNTALHQALHMHIDMSTAARDAWRMRCSNTHDLRERNVEVSELMRDQKSYTTYPE